MMLAFETRCRQFQLGVQEYCSPQKEDQRPPLLNLKIRRTQPTLEDVIATKPSCKMQFALSTVTSYIKPKRCNQVYEALREEGSGQAQFESMKKFLAKLIELLKKWERSCCEKCGPIFHRYEYWIKFDFQQMDMLINDLEEPGQRAQSFNSTIKHWKQVIKMFSSQNQCITISERTKTKQEAYRREESSDDEKSEQPRQRTNEQQFKIEE